MHRWIPGSLASQAPRNDKVSRSSPRKRGPSFPSQKNRLGPRLRGGERSLSRSPSFRDGRRPGPESRQDLMHRWIPGSLASQAPRNDKAAVRPRESGDPVHASLTGKVWAPACAGANGVCHDLRHSGTAKGRTRNPDKPTCVAGFRVRLLRKRPGMTKSAVRPRESGDPASHKVRRPDWAPAFAGASGVCCPPAW